MSQRTVHVWILSLTVRIVLTSPIALPTLLSVTIMMIAIMAGMNHRIAVSIENIKSDSYGYVTGGLNP